MVKKIEPTKKIAASTPDPKSWTTPGNGATRKQVAPIAKRTPIHHDALRGAHQTPGVSWDLRHPAIRRAQKPQAAG